jgi:uncharacterized integral membrane protein
MPARWRGWQIPLGTLALLMALTGGVIGAAVAWVQAVAPVNPARRTTKP